MAASDHTVAEVLRVIRKHVDQATLEKIMDELLDVPGNESFRKLCSRGNVHRESMVFFGSGLIGSGFVTCRRLIIMPSSITPWPVVKSGSNGHPIKTLQYLLRARGHTVGVDGVFGPKTEAAVREFQANHALAADGIVTPMTWAALVVQVEKGSRGDAVRGVQEEFQFRNLSGNPSNGPQVDGIFGAATDAAVRGFQQALSLDIASVKVDGSVGRVTWQALVSGMLSF
jgi:lysozyme family protein